MAHQSADNSRVSGRTIGMAVAVLVVGTAATLFRPAYTIEAPPRATVAAASAGKTAIVAAQATERPGNDAVLAVLTTGRSVDAPKLSLPAGETERLFEKGQAMLSAGDFAAARLLLSRAADAGHAGALYALASTYDPNVLAARGARGLTGEPEQAREIYARALAAGVEGARQKLSALGG